MTRVPPRRALPFVTRWYRNPASTCARIMRWRPSCTRVSALVSTRVRAVSSRASAYVRAHMIMCRRRFLCGTAPACRSPGGARKPLVAPGRREERRWDESPCCRPSWMSVVPRPVRPTCENRNILLNLHKRVCAAPQRAQGSGLLAARCCQALQPQTRVRV